MYEDGLVKLKKIWDESAVASVKQQKTTLEKKVSSLVKDTQKALKKVRPQQILTYSHSRSKHTTALISWVIHTYSRYIFKSPLFSALLDPSRNPSCYCSECECDDCGFGRLGRRRRARGPSFDCD